MKVKCMHCGASGQMDETKIPPGVTSINCPRCKQSFPIPTIDDADSQSLGEDAPNMAQASVSPLQSPPPQVAAPYPSLNQLPPASVSPPSQAATVATANCTICSGEFPKDEMVRFGTSWVCAACKPSYVQMLAQGTPRPGDIRHAGFRIRFGAKFLDGLILWVLNFMLTLLAGLALPKSSPQTAVASSVIMMILQMVIAASYSGYFLAKYRATPGKMACGLQVMTPEGEQINFGRGVGRYFAELLSSMILMVGYLMVLFDAEKRALHDRICNTRVVYK